MILGEAGGGGGTSRNGVVCSGGGAVGIGVVRGATCLGNGDGEGAGEDGRNLGLVCDICGVPIGIIGGGRKGGGEAEGGGGDGGRGDSAATISMAQTIGEGVNERSSSNESSSASSPSKGSTIGRTASQLDPKSRVCTPESVCVTMTLPAVRKSS